MYPGSFSGNADWSFEKMLSESGWRKNDGWNFKCAFGKKSFKLFRCYKKCQKDECAEVSKKTLV